MSPLCFPVIAPGLSLRSNHCTLRVAGAAMFFLARSQGNPMALSLGFIVVAAMTGSCVVSGIFGAVVPIVLRRLGADPATASSIFLTTATDVASMGLLLLRRRRIRLVVRDGGAGRLPRGVGGGDT
mgnify:CR=1 FL=1